MNDEETTLHDIDRRLIVLEERSEKAQALKNWLMGLVGLVVIQLGGFAYAWGQFANRLNNIDVSALEQSLSTSLTVLADHGTELAHLRGEISHLRGQVDSKTSDRFTGSQGAAQEERIRRLEDRVLFK
jgi:hypothetical protein